MMNQTWFLYSNWVYKQLTGSAESTIMTLVQVNETLVMTYETPGPHYRLGIYTLCNNCLMNDTEIMSTPNVDSVRNYGKKGTVVDLLYLSSGGLLEARRTICRFLSSFDFSW